MSGRWCRACNGHTDHIAGSRYLFCDQCGFNNYTADGRPTEAPTTEPERSLDHLQHPARWSFGRSCPMKRPGWEPMTKEARANVAMVMVDAAGQYWINIGQLLLLPDNTQGWTATNPAAIIAAGWLVD